MTTEYPDVDGVGDEEHQYWAFDVEESDKTCIVDSDEDVYLNIQRAPSRAVRMKDVFRVSVCNGTTRVPYFYFYIRRCTGDADFTHSFCGGNRRTPRYDGVVEIPYIHKGTQTFETVYLRERNELHVQHKLIGVFGSTHWLRLRLPEDFWGRDLFSGGDRQYVKVTLTGHYAKHFDLDYGEDMSRRHDEDEDNDKRERDEEDEDPLY